MNIEDLKKIKDMAIKNADRIVVFAKEINDRSALLQAQGALAFAMSVISGERLNMLLNDMNQEVKEIDDMYKLIDKKMNDIWEKN